MSMMPIRAGRRIAQAGVSLMELLIAMAISLVVSLAMVSLMANTMGTGTETIEMSRLTAELRTTMQLMSRDLRRANYHGNFAKCFGNPSCRDTLDNSDGDATGYIKAITIDDSVSNGADDCFYFWFDRDSDGLITDDAVGAFRREVVGGIGVIQMTIADVTPNCSADGNWITITDPEFVDITDFTVSDTLSFTDTISASSATQTVGRIGMSITGQLVRNNEVQKNIIDFIRVRNDIFAEP